MAKSWWRTIPGIITAIAGFITAITGLIVVLHEVGWVSPRSNEPTHESSPVPTPPSLVLPPNGATMPQPYNQPWVFRWDGPSNPDDVERYELLVMKNGAPSPIIDKLVAQNTLTDQRSKCFYLAEKDQFLWKVRVQNRQGTWSGWSREFLFNVEEFDPELYAEKCPSARPKSPTLRLPGDGTTLTYSGNWTFSWSEPAKPNDVRQYHLIVEKAGEKPFVDIKLNEATYSTKPPSPSPRELWGYYDGKNRLNWKWKVRVQNKPGVWSNWSKEFSFNVASSLATGERGKYESSTPVQPRKSWGQQPSTQDRPILGPITPSKREGTLSR